MFVFVDVCTDMLEIVRYDNLSLRTDLAELPFDELRVATALQKCPACNPGSGVSADRQANYDKPVHR